MGYIFLAAALFSGLTKGYLGKLTSNTASDTNKALLISAVRMFFCTVIGLLLPALQGELSCLNVDIQVLLVCIMSGAGTTFFVVSWLLSVRKSAYMMLDIFLTLGTLVPIVAGSFMYDESIKLSQWLGMVLLVVAVVIMCGYNNRVKGKMTLPALFLIVLCGVANGITQFSQKMFVREYTGVPISVFNFYTYLFSFIIIGALYIFTKKRDDGTVPKIKKLTVHILLMALCLFANSYFSTAAAQYLDSIILYPLQSAASLILATVMSAVCFKEKITVKSIAGICLCFVSLVIINVL